ncbi:hypothetical protein GHT06_020229 [Daphnia sinensis]|uniref:Uncharacterized protein n=1 Tax=Daphnia sinensis TaxID=1820382 RepID=A0AAD5L3A7_9CRUS|nr:hypothetical protein GHT06_020229 [Daphnia sinensis]
MISSEDKFVYLREPEDYGYWLRTIDTEIINCVLETIQLRQQTANANFSTPLGTASATTGVLSHNHLTLMWDKTYTHSTEHEYQLVESGDGTLIKQTGDEKKFRLQDDNNQLDFHLILQPSCNLAPSCTNKTSHFHIIGHPKLFILTGNVKENSSVLTATTKQPPSSAEIVKTPANLQYIRNQLTDHENELARLIQTLQCDSRKAKHERAIVTAQYNGWLAASQLQLPQCTKIQAYGKTAVVIQCKALNVTFDTVITPCGPQPKFHNFTINLDGWELVKYSPCYWANGFYEHRSNPAYSDTLLNHMNIMADIAAMMTEHSQSVSSIHEQLSNSNIFETASNAEHYLGWWETLKNYMFFAIVILMAITVIRIACWLGVFDMIYILCCRLEKTPTTLDPDAIPLN